jgi:hypothetical protein
VNACVYEPWFDVESRGLLGGPEVVRRDAAVLDRESEKNRRVDELRLGGA